MKFLKNDFDPSRYVFVPQAAAGAGESAGSSSAPAVVEVLQSPSLQREKPPLAEEGGGNEEETIDEKQDSKATPEDDPDAPNDFEILDRPTTATSDANGEESRIGHRYNLYAVCVRRPLVLLSTNVFLPRFTPVLWAEVITLPTLRITKPTNGTSLMTARARFVFLSCA